MKLHCIICGMIYGDITSLGRHVKENHKPVEKNKSFFG